MVWQPGVRAGEGEQGAPWGESREAALPPGPCPAAGVAVTAVAVTRVSASLQGFSFLLSLICCDSMKALGLRRRLPLELYNVHFEIIFLQDL